MSNEILKPTEDVVYPRRIFTMYEIDCHKFWDSIDEYPEGSAM